MGRPAPVGACAVLAWLVSVAPLACQSTSRWSFGGSATASLWLGESDVLDGSVGLDATVWWRVGAHLSLRADGMLMPLEEHVDLGGSADNRVVVLAVGPDLDIRLGPLSLYGRILLGHAFNQQARSRSTLQERTTRAGVFGSGVGLRLEASRSVALDFGADLLSVRELDFARAAGSIVTDSDVLRARAGVRIGGL